MALKTALSRRRRKIPTINNLTAGLSLTKDLSKTTQTLGCYIWPRGWVTKKRPKHWKNNPKKLPKRLNPEFRLKKLPKRLNPAFGLKI